MIRLMAMREECRSEGAENQTVLEMEDWVPKYYV
jgi:hypothetical protein